jgi:hypothetical protein
MIQHSQSSVSAKCKGLERHEEQVTTSRCIQQRHQHHDAVQKRKEAMVHFIRLEFDEQHDNSQNTQWGISGNH